MFDLAPLQVAQKVRATPGLWLGEIVGTAGLVALIFTLARTGRAAQSAAAVAAYIGAAYWFTSSTSFANPAVSIGRMFSDTFAGIAPASVPGFVVAQLVGAALGAGLVILLHPTIARSASRPPGRTRARGSTGHGNRYLARLLGEAAVGAGHTGTFLGERYRRFARRRGKKKAIVAVGRSLLVIIRHLLSDPEAHYSDLGSANYPTHINLERHKRNHVHQLEAMGYTVTVEPAA